jgi:hypothetical protein
MPYSVIIIISDLFYNFLAGKFYKPAGSGRSYLKAARASASLS